ncbi:Pyridoxamine 5'-phosphate oxidase [Streptomyces sp. YIM 130001]|uniref:helix-turn-helix domain-containing protein n=1 Tax=Streptomyces sp. YIM 130001 TaxID=2259644 RepID=UPI000E6515B2|nr:pyridoxamine 5'-phosphate oxidase family protein [Streptomyces sp. YIM 130001]RII09293.1 Pyridoxamine 5'-phosphate oxidase [Streptomyces sp. YIM 130001]
MTESTDPRSMSEGDASAGSDLGRRVAALRSDHALTVEELAERVGSSPEYIRYVESHPSAPGIGFVTRVADALGSSPAELSGADVDQPPGRAPESGYADLVRLPEGDCRDLVGFHGIGRFGLADRDGLPAIVPVNYVVTADGHLAVRTTEGTVVAGAAGQTAAFEVDRIDEVTRTGWSVLFVGEAREVQGPAEQERLDALSPNSPWRGGGTEQWVVLTPRRVTGRLIHRPD